MITLIRHAESTFNAVGDRSRDCPLTNRGHAQARGLKGTYDCVVCSTLKRARQTLDSSRLVYGHVIFTELCREVRDGNPVNLYPDEQNIVESREVMHDRVNQFKSFLKTLQIGYPRIAIISHSGFLRELSGSSFQNAEEKTFSL